MWGLAWQVFNRFFWGTKTLNRGERDQPAPLEVQREHLRAELAQVEDEINNNRITEFDTGEKEAPSEDEAP